MLQTRRRRMLAPNDAIFLGVRDASDKIHSSHQSERITWLTDTHTHTHTHDTKPTTRLGGRDVKQD